MLETTQKETQKNSMKTTGGPMTQDSLKHIEAEQRNIFDDTQDERLPAFGRDAEDGMKMKDVGFQNLLMPGEGSTGVEEVAKKQASRGVKPKGRSRRVSVSAECFSASEFQGMKMKRGSKLLETSLISQPTKEEEEGSDMNLERHEKSADDIDHIKQGMASNFLFANLSEEDKHQLCSCMFKKVFQKDSFIITQCQKGDHFYILLKGICKVLVNDKVVLTYDDSSLLEAKDAAIVKETAPSRAEERKVHSFGELALMYNCPRQASVQAVTVCEVYVLDRLTYRYVISSKHMERKQFKDRFLKQCELFKTLQDSEIRTISDVMTEETYEKNEVIIQEGDEDYENMKFYLILEGSAEAFKTALNNAEQPSWSSSIDQNPQARRKTAPIPVQTVVCLPQIGSVSAIENAKGESGVKLPVVNSPGSPESQLTSGLQPTEPIPLRRSFSEMDDVTGATSFLPSPPKRNVSDRTVSFSPKTAQTAQPQSPAVNCVGGQGTQPRATGERVGVMTVGQFFGEKALVEKKPRAASVHAVTKLTCGVLDVASFERLLGNCSDILNREIEKYKLQAKTTADRETARTEQC